MPFICRPFDGLRDLGLVDRPSRAAVEQVVHVLDLRVGLLVFNDLVKAVVEGRGLHVADDTDGDGEMRRHHVCQHHVDTRVLSGLVVDEDVLLGDAVLADGDHFKFVAIEADTLIAVLTEDERLAVYALHLHVVADVLASDVFVNAIRENHAVLQDLGHGDAVVLVRLPKDLAQFLRVDVNATGEESGLGADGEFARIERILVGALRRSLGLRATESAGRELTLGHTVDTVVEQDQVDVDVTTAGVDEVVATDGGAVAVASDHPHTEVRVGQLDASGGSGSTTVDAMETVGIHVVGEARGAADAADDNDVFLLLAQLREYVLNGLQDGVVTTTGAPFHHLIACKIFFGQHDLLFDILIFHSRIILKGR